jgi:hypothetical protein
MVPSWGILLVGAKKRDERRRGGDGRRRGGDGRRRGGDERIRGGDERRRGGAGMRGEGAGMRGEGAGMRGEGAGTKRDRLAAEVWQCPILVLTQSFCLNQQHQRRELPGPNR